MNVIGREPCVRCSLTSLRSTYSPNQMPSGIWGLWGPFWSLYWSVRSKHLLVVRTYPFSRPPLFPALCCRTVEQQYVRSSSMSRPQGNAAKGHASLSLPLVVPACVSDTIRPYNFCFRVASTYSGWHHQSSEFSPLSDFCGPPNGTTNDC